MMTRPSFSVSGCLAARRISTSCMWTGKCFHNKWLSTAGAVAMRLRVHDSGMGFVVAHLSSGESEGDDAKRNYDYSEIVRRLQFPPDVEGAVDADALLGTSSSGVNKVHAPICVHTCVG